MLEREDYLAVGCEALLNEYRNTLPHDLNYIYIYIYIYLEMGLALNFF